MNDWEAMLSNSYKEMEGLKIGTRVMLNFLGNPTGRVVDVRGPIGLLAPGYRCLWDNGEYSGWLSGSELEIIGE